MESSTILTPPSIGLSGSWFLTESNIPKGPEYEKISTLYRCTGIYKDVYFCANATSGLIMLQTTLYFHYGEK